MKKAILSAVLALCVSAPAMAGDRYYRDHYHDRGYGHHHHDDYYAHCHRDKGTGGAIAGAVGGALVGNAVAGHGDKALGTVVGAGAGALVGRSLDRGDIKCR
jgi:hypothetical protein